jgi:hypothetical protein
VDTDIKDIICLSILLDTYMCLEQKLYTVLNKTIKVRKPKNRKGKKYFSIPQFMANPTEWLQEMHTKRQFYQTSTTKTHTDPAKISFYMLTPTNEHSMQRQHLVPTCFSFMLELNFTGIHSLLFFR